MKSVKNIIKGVLSAIALTMVVQTGVATEVIPSSTNQPSEGERIIVQQDDRWIAVSIINPGLPETNPENQRVEEAPTQTEPSSGCSTSNTGQICSVKLDFSSADQEEIADLLDQLDNPSQPNPTIDDFMEAGAKHAGPGETPVYARLTS